MPEHAEPIFGPVRFEDAPALMIAGFGRRFTAQTIMAIPALWQEFVPFLGKVPGQMGTFSYGLCCHPDGHGGFEYIAGVQVDSLEGLPQDFRCLSLAPQHYAVFEHHGHLSGLSETFERIWQDWLPLSGFKAADAPEFERYAQDYDAQSSAGVVEIWLPLKP